MSMIRCKHIESYDLSLIENVYALNAAPGSSKIPAFTDATTFDTRCFDSTEYHLLAHDSSVYITCGSAALHRTFHMDYPIKTALWFAFQPSTPTSEHLCLAGSERLDVYSRGHHDALTLPFNAAAVWPSPMGLVIERHVSSTERAAVTQNGECMLPVVYSLQNPLSEVIACIIKGGPYKESRYMCSLASNIVGACESLGLLVIYDSTEHVHSVWYVRDAKRQDVSDAVKHNLEMSKASLMSQQQAGGSLATMRLTRALAARLRSANLNDCEASELTPFKSALANRALTDSTTGGGTTATSTVTGATTSSLPGISSLLTSASNVGEEYDSPPPPIVHMPPPTPRYSARKKTPATVKPMQTPMQAAGSSVVSSTPLTRSRARRLQQQVLASSTPSGATPLLRRAQLQQQQFISDLSPIVTPNTEYTPAAPSLQNSTASSVRSSFLPASHWPEENLIPTVCLEHVWTEPPTLSNNASANQRATKVFLTYDFIGHRFLCLLSPESKQLRLVRVKDGVDKQGYIIVNSATVEALDALDIPDRNLMVVIQPTLLNSQCVLYSGVLRLCVLEFPPPLCDMMLTTSTSLMGRFAPPLDGVRPLGDTAMYGVESSLLRSLLRAPKSEGRFYGCLENKQLMSATIPAIASSSVVRRAVCALSVALPNDVAMQMCAAWYRNRNGADAMQSEQEELHRFLDFVLNICSLGKIEGSMDDGSATSELLSPSKKQRLDDDAAEMSMDVDGAFSKLLSSSLHISNSSGTRESRFDKILRNRAANPVTAQSFKHVKAVFFALHCVFEDLKLDVRQSETREMLGITLFVLASALKFEPYCEHYMRDNPNLLRFALEDTVESLPVFSQADLSTLFSTSSRFWQPQPPCIYSCISSLLRKDITNTPVFVALPVCERSIHTLLLIAALCENASSETDALIKRWNKPDLTTLMSSSLNLASSKRIESLMTILNDSTLSQTIRISRLFEASSMRNHLSSLPSGVALIIADRLYKLRLRHLLSHIPIVRGPPNEYRTHDFASALKNSANNKLDAESVESAGDGMRHLVDNAILTRFRFGNDSRATVAMRWLRCSEPIVLTRVSAQQTEENDSDYRSRVQRALLSASHRTMATCVGRGMFTYQTRTPTVCEKVGIPALNLKGRVAPKPSLIDFSSIDTAPNYDVWPKFHNGVASGLSLRNVRRNPQDQQTSSTATALAERWILYNLPHHELEITPETSGFLLGLALNGHLSDLELFTVHQYLNRSHPFTSMAVILGLCADKLGTCDQHVMKMLSIHLPLLLPSMSLIDLSIDHCVLVSATLGLGLLYAESGHSVLVEKLVAEIGKLPSSDVNTSSERESYALSCGLAAGWIQLGQGTSSSRYHNTVELLRSYLHGGQRSTVQSSGLNTSVNDDSPCDETDYSAAQQTPAAPASEQVNQVQENDLINTDVTAPAAAVTLALMYLQTDNEEVSKLLACPHSFAILEGIRPDIILIRTLSYCLVMWSEVAPSREYVLSRLSEPLKLAINTDTWLFRDTFLQQRRDSHDPVDLVHLAQCYANIIGGACLGIAFRFAGSANSEAYQTILYFCKKFLQAIGNKSPTVMFYAGTFVRENCLQALVFSLGILMAGTGHLEVLRIIRILRRRTAAPRSGIVYGTQMALHMTLGLLFLGAGRYSLRTDKRAIAALLTAFYPKLPATSTTDNRYHLQAFRHLYVLATEHRLLIPREIESGDICSLSVRFRFHPNPRYSAFEYTTVAPCIAPEGYLLAGVQVEDDRYISAEMERGDGGRDSRFDLWVRRRQGFLSYEVDKDGYRSAGLTAVLQRVREWKLEDDPTAAHAEYDCLRRSVTNFAARCEVQEIVPYLQQLYECLHNPYVYLASPLNVWQLFILGVYLSHHEKEPRVFNREMLLSLQLCARNHLIEQVDGRLLQHYISKWSDTPFAREFAREDYAVLATFLVYFNVPRRSQWSELRLRDYRSLRIFAEKLLSHLQTDAESAVVIHQVLTSLE